MPKFRKKPIVVEAFQWHGKFNILEIEPCDKFDYRVCEHCGVHLNTHGRIKTLEGSHIVCPEDWIITGIQGEKYPCKPDIFEKTYVKVEEATTEQETPFIPKERASCVHFDSSRYINGIGHGIVGVIGPHCKAGKEQVPFYTGMRHCDEPALCGNCEHNSTKPPVKTHVETILERIEDIIAYGVKIKRPEDENDRMKPSNLDEAWESVKMFRQLAIDAQTTITKQALEIKGLKERHNRKERERQAARRMSDCEVDYAKQMGRACAEHILGRVEKIKKPEQEKTNKPPKKDSKGLFKVYPPRQDNPHAVGHTIHCPACNAWACTTDFHNWQVNMAEYTCTSCGYKTSLRMKQESWGRMPAPNKTADFPL